jgi:uncharacterized protein (DUF1697 family)
MTYCVFLRGINLNGITMKMADLKQALAFGFSSVKTVLATGNVLIEDADDRSRDQLVSVITQGLRDYFHYDAHLFLRGQAEIASVLTAARELSVPAGCHTYWLLFDHPERTAELAQLFDLTPHAADERFIPLESGAFWIVPKGETLSSTFGAKVLGQKKNKSALTSRNINTIQKICNAMPE